MWDCCGLCWSVEHKMKMKIKVDSSFSFLRLLFLLLFYVLLCIIIFNADLWADAHLTLNISIYGFTFTVTLNITILGKFTCLLNQPIFFNFSSNVFLSHILISFGFFLRLRLDLETSFLQIVFTSRALGLRSCCASFS